MAFYISCHDPSCTNVDPSLQVRGPAKYRVLLTCQAFYLEARQPLASCLQVFIFDLKREAVKRVLRAFKDDTFLRFAIPYVRCLHVAQHGQGCLELVHAFPNLQVLRLLSTVYIDQPQLSPEDFMSSASDRSIIQSLQTEIKQYEPDFGERSYEIHMQCCITPDLEDDRFRYVRVSSNDIWKMKLITAM